MSTWIKAGFWEKLCKNCKGYNGWLNLEELIKKVAGSGGGGVTEITYTNLQTLIASNSLVPGVTYKITGFNKNMPTGGPDNLLGYLPEVLYDDGTNSGVTIYMEALTTNTLSTSGYGEFYNPTYGDGNTYNNTDGTGLYGIWDGDNPDPLQVPAYQVGDVVFWGGYAWENTTGNVGNYIDTFTLDSLDWVKLPYSNTTWYTKVIDEIKVDWNNRIVIERYNPENQIRVKFNADEFSWWSGLNGFTNPSRSSISAMGWGLYSKITPEGIDSDFYGIASVEADESYLELVNFKGATIIDIHASESSSINENYFGINTYLAEHKLRNSSIRFNTVTLGGYFIRITGFGMVVSSNIFQNAGLYDIQSTNPCFIQDNTLSGSSEISFIHIEDGFSNISLNTLSFGSVMTNCRIGGNNCAINSNTLDSSNIWYNDLNDGSSIINNNLSNTSFIQNNILNGGSSIITCTLNASRIWKNTLDIGSLISSVQMTAGSEIGFNTLTRQGVIIAGSIDTGSQIFQNFVTNGSSITFNNLSDNSTINYNDLSQSFIEDNSLGDTGKIERNTLKSFSRIKNNTITDNSSIISNELSSDSRIQQNTIDAASLITINVLTNDSDIQNNLLDGSLIIRNFLTNSIFDFSATGTISGKVIQSNNATNANAIVDLTGANFIYQDYTKYLFRRSDNTTRLSYYNNSDVLTVVNVNA